MDAICVAQAAAGNEAGRNALLALTAVFASTTAAHFTSKIAKKASGTHMQCRKNPSASEAAKPRRMTVFINAIADESFASALKEDDIEMLHEEFGFIYAPSDITAQEILPILMPCPEVESNCVTSFLDFAKNHAASVLTNSQHLRLACMAERIPCLNLEEYRLTKCGGVGNGV